MPSTIRYKRGDVVLVPFPFTDLSSSKCRPALVSSPDSFNSQQQDLVLAAITSHITEDKTALLLANQDFSEGWLPKTSVVKVNKLFTMHSTLIVKRIAGLRAERVGDVLEAIRAFFS